MVLTAFASAAPLPAAESEAAVCEVVAAQMHAAPSAPKAHCWKKIGLGKILPSCPTERAILTGFVFTAPVPQSETVSYAQPAPLFVVDIGFDPPPPKT